MIRKHSDSISLPPVLTTRLTRRAALTAATGTALATMTLRAQEGSPEASPGSTPMGTPVATPAPVTPEPVHPLKLIEDQRPHWAGQPKSGGDLNLFVHPEFLQDFTPTTFQQDFGVMMSYLDPLVWADQVTLEPKPWLARSWAWRDDGMALDVVLREGVMWHDGSPFTAEDVRFSLLCYRDDYNSTVSFLLAVMRDVDVVDDLAVTIHFDEPDGNFPFNAANLPMISRSQWEDHWLRNPLGERTLSGFNFGNGHPLGTGAWVMTDRGPDAIRFRRNQDHFAAVPWTETLSFSAAPAFDDQLDAWKDNNVDLIWPFPGTEVEANLQEPGFLVVADSTISFFAAFNFGNPLRAEPGLLALPGIREAMNLAIDRKGYAARIFGDMIDVDRAGFMTQPWAVDPLVRNPAHDIEAARHLLAANGWTDRDGDGVLDSPTGDRGAFTCIVRDDADPNLLAILDTLDADFRKIGLTVDIQRLPVSEFTNRWMNVHDYDLIAIQLHQYPAFNEFDLVGAPWSIRRNPAGWNPGGYWNPAVDEAIMAYLQTVDVDDMKTQLSIIQHQTNDDPFALWLGFPKQPVLIRPDVSGFQPNKMWQSWNTWALWLDEDASIVTPTPVPSTPYPDRDATPVTTPVGRPVATPET